MGRPRALPLSLFFLILCIEELFELTQLSGVPVSKDVFKVVSLKALCVSCVTNIGWTEERSSYIGQVSVLFYSFADLWAPETECGPYSHFRDGSENDKGLSLLEHWKGHKEFHPPSFPFLRDSCSRNS